MRARLQCEVPNADLHKFKGRFNMEPAGSALEFDRCCMLWQTHVLL